MYQGLVETDKCINRSFDEVTRHYHVIANMTGAMAKRYVCDGCNKVCKYSVVHTCEQTFSDCMVRPPCISTGIRIPCDICNGHFMGQTCFDNHQQRKREVIRRTHVSIVIVVVRVALWSPTIRTNGTNDSVSHVKKQRGRSPLLYASTSELAGIQRACAVLILQLRDYAGHESLG